VAARLKVRRTSAGSQVSIFDIDENVNASCPAVASIRILSSESKLMILRHLLQGPKGFNELLRASGINSKTLSATLRSLEKDRIVIREVLSTRPFAVRYSLSPAGFDLAPVFEAMGEWGRKWLPNLANEKQNA
jgi:DNA-binding HxlR family transcriptional regulator